MLASSIAMACSGSSARALCLLVAACGSREKPKAPPITTTFIEAEPDAAIDADVPDLPPLYAKLFDLSFSTTFDASVVEYFGKRGHSIERGSVFCSVMSVEHTDAGWSSIVECQGRPTERTNPAIREWMLSPGPWPDTTGVTFVGTPDGLFLEGEKVVPPKPEPFRSRTTTFAQYGDLWCLKGKEWVMCLREGEGLVGGARSASFDSEMPVEKHLFYNAWGDVPDDVRKLPPKLAIDLPPFYAKLFEEEARWVLPLEVTTDRKNRGEVVCWINGVRAIRGGYSSELACVQRPTDQTDRGSGHPLSMGLDVLPIHFMGGTLYGTRDGLWFADPGITNASKLDKKLRISPAVPARGKRVTKDGMFELAPHGDSWCMRWSRDNLQAWEAVCLKQGVGIVGGGGTSSSGESRFGVPPPAHAWSW
jgi:hypothetical protein